MTAFVHQAFTWVEGNVLDVEGAEFAALTYDVCAGLQTCLQLDRSTELNNSGGDAKGPRILGHVDRERILLLATAAVRMLGDRAESRVDALNKQGRKLREQGKMSAIFHPEHGWLTGHPRVCLLILAGLVVLNGAI